MNLEAGKLTEDLLPPSELKKIGRTSFNLTAGCKLMDNIFWYYSKLKVSVIQLDHEFIYNVEIPFVSSKSLIAHSFLSFPIPNKARNVSLRLQVENTVVINPLSGNISPVKHCIGQNPLVCPPLPVYHNPGSSNECSGAIVKNEGIFKKISFLTLVELKIDHFKFFRRS